MLSPAQTDELCNALLFFNMSELRSLCLNLGLSSKGEKSLLIEVIRTFLITGRIMPLKVIPKIACAKPTAAYPLLPGAPMLYGAFKNDLKTRLFLKSLIGNHFHYTAFGLDWIKERWQQGMAPTYQEFANYWQSEYLARQKIKGKLKPEWAYLNFLESYRRQHPSSSRADAIVQWKKLRMERVKKAQALLQDFSNNLKKV